MVDTKFLIVTTLCYVGIFVVVLVVFCCAWTRYMRNEGRLPPRRTKLSHGRRAAREPAVPQQCAQLPTPSRQYRYIGDFTELTHQHPPIIYDPHVRPNFCSQAGNIPRQNYPNMNHYALVEDYTPRNFYPDSLATPTDTYDIDLRMDLVSNTYGDTSHGGFSGDEFSDFQSSRYDSRQDFSGAASGEFEGDVLSNSDVENSLKNGNTNSLDRITNEIDIRRSSDRIKQGDSDDEHILRSRGNSDIKCSSRTNSDVMADRLFVTSCSDDCNGVGITPSCSVQSLTEFNEEPEHVPLNIN